MKLLRETRVDWCRLYFISLGTLTFLTFFSLVADTFIHHHSYPRSAVGDLWVTLTWFGDPCRKFRQIWVISSALLILSCPLFFRVRRSWGWLAAGSAGVMFSLTVVFEWLLRSRLLWMWEYSR